MRWGVLSKSFFMAKAFLSEGPAKDPAYSNFRDLPDERVGVYRRFVESLWERYRGNEDKNFLSNAKDQFHQRFWEMYLWVALDEMGLDPQSHGSEGPDLYVDIDGRKFWIEAVCPTGGYGPDAIPDEISVFGEASEVPVDAIMLAFTNSIRKKYKKHECDVEKYGIDSGDGFIIAVCSGAMPISARAGGEIPYIVKSCYGIGSLTLAINAATLNREESFYQERLDCRRHTGSAVSLASLRSGNHRLLSAVLYSAVNCTSTRCALGGDFELLLNVDASVKVSADLFPTARSWWYESGQLNSIPRSE
jgi:hypothetical protein